MVLNYIWIFFFLIAFVVGLIKVIFFNDYLIFSEMVDALFSRAELGFKLSIGLTGVLAFWLGIMKVGENGGAIRILSRAMSPLFSKLFPEVPKNHPAIGSMVMNFSANMLGLDNAATPLGLKAMNQLQEVNPTKDRASNAQIMFLVLNTSGLTIIPVSILALRATEGSINPTDVFIPILLATFCSSFFGLIITSIIQKINLFNKVVFAYLGSALTVLGALVFYVSTLSKADLQIFSSLLSGILLFGIIISFITLALFRKVNVYESFIEGAKEGFVVAIKIVPYLIAILCAIGVFTASGAMDVIINGFALFFEFLGFDIRFVDALPTAIMKPFSGGGARGAMIESWEVAKEAGGVDSFVGKLTSVLQGSTETTFYVLALYFGSVNIKNTRYAASLGLFVDLIGIVSAILLGYLFFG